MDEWKTPHFSRDLAALRRGESVVSPQDGAPVHPSEYIVIEEPMGRARAEMAPHVDFVAIIDTPLEIALARRFFRGADQVRSQFDPESVEKASKEEVAEGARQIISSLSEYLHNYLDDGFREVYTAVQEQAKATCDLVLDGCLPADELAKQLVAAVKARIQE